MFGENWRPAAPVWDGHRQADMCPSDPPFDRLPAELVSRILGLVDKTLVTRARLVCVAFRDRIDADVLQRLVMMDSVADARYSTTMRSLLRRAGRLEHLSTRFHDLLPDVTCALRSLTIALTQNSSSPAGLGHACRFEALTDLHVMMHRAPLTDLSPLASCVQLHTLVLSNRETDPETLCLLSDVSPLAAMPSLTSLSVTGCQMLVDVRPLSSCRRLAYLKLACRWLTDLSPLSACVSLRRLDLSHPRRRYVPGPRAVLDVSPLAALPQLHTLNLHTHGFVTDISPLLGCAALTSLDVTDCWALRGMSALGGMSRLSRLLMMRANEQNLPVDLPSSLTSLAITECGKWPSLPPCVSSLVSLSGLSLMHCLHLTDISALSHLTALTALVMDELPASVDLTPLSSCTRLLHLYIPPSHASP